MSATIMEGQLVMALATDSALGAAGVVVNAARGSGVEILVRGDTVGHWRWRKGVFAFTRAGELDASREVDTVAEAVHYTRDQLRDA